jgi:hypothetical protein
MCQKQQQQQDLSHPGFGLVGFGMVYLFIHSVTHLLLAMDSIRPTCLVIILSNSLISPKFATIVS